MLYLNTDQIQANLDSLGTKISFIDSKTIEVTDTAAWIPVGGNGIEHQSTISSYTDLVRTNRLWIEKKIQHHFTVNCRSEHFAIYQLMIAILTQCKMAQHFPYIELDRSLWDSFEQIGIGTYNKDLSVFIRLRDPRRILNSIVPAILNVSCAVVFFRIEISYADLCSSFEIDNRDILDGLNYQQLWTYNTIGGKGLFLVLYSKRCSHRQCLNCILWKLGDTQKICSYDINKQIGQALISNLYDDEKLQIQEIVLSNNGSVLDPDTFPVSSLLYFFSIVSKCLLNVKKIILETRAQFVNEIILETITNSIKFDRNDICLELAIGMEVFDEDLRNKIYHKGLSNKEIKTMANIIQHKKNISLRFYMMYKPIPEMTIERANKDICEAIFFFDALIQKHGIAISMHLNPTYIAKGSKTEKLFHEGKYFPPSLSDLRHLLKSIGRSKTDIHVGLNDEGLAILNGSFLDYSTEDDINRLRKFNLTGDFDIL